MSWAEPQTLGVKKPAKFLDSAGLSTFATDEFCRHTWIITWQCTECKIDSVYSTKNQLIAENLKASHSLPQGLTDFGLGFCIGFGRAIKCERDRK